MSDALARIGSDLARIRLLLDQPQQRSARMRRHWLRELEQLDALHGALAALDPDSATSPATSWLETLRQGTERLGRTVVGSGPSKGQDQDPQASERKGDPEKKRAPEKKAKAKASASAPTRADAIREALEFYPVFLDEDLERARAGALARAEIEGSAPVEVPPLPVLAERERIVAALQQHDVLLLVGETGSGKSLLSPLFALEAGLGQARQIIQTQPRRVAARQIASRLAQMTGGELGQTFGCQTRLDKSFGKQTVVKVATDGILLQELRGDPLLSRYDLVILDEAHERSINIDLLLGLLWRVRQQRFELKLLVTSATLERERFAQFFDLGDAQQIVVPGRLYPVEMSYSADDDEAGDDPDALGLRIAEVIKGVIERGDPGDVLVFLPRYKEIAAASRAMRQRKLPGVEVLTMHGRQDPDENARCFAPSQRRKVILATNIAETSITLPGIRTVIDSGLVNLKQFDPKTGITSLMPRPISAASASQRAGRAGRLAEGRCIRLWAEEDHALRKAYTEPEIRRSDLAALVLQMANLDIEDIPRFPFLTKPASQQLGEARRALIELGALERGGPITPLGRRLAGLPLEPRIGRLLLAAEEEQCVEAALTITAALSVSRSLFRQPRPDDPAADAKRAAVNKIKRSLASGGSDFDVILTLVDGYRERRWKERRAYCEANQASLIALEEICAIRADLADGLRGRRQGRGRRKGKGRPAEKPVADERSASLRERLARTLLAGLLGNVCVGVGRYQYSTAEGEEVYLHPGSVVFSSKPRPQLVAAGQIQRGEARTFARHVLPLKLLWLEQVCPQLLSYMHRNVRYDVARGKVLADEDIFFRQLTVSEGQQIDLFGRDPERAIKVLIEEGLLAEQLDVDLDVHRRNLAVIEQCRQLANRLGDPALAPEEEHLHALYATRLAGCRSGRDVSKRLAGKEHSLLGVRQQDLLEPAVLERARAWYPEFIELAGARCKVSYVFNPWKGKRATTIRVPARVALQLDEEALRAIPGLAVEQYECWLEVAGRAGRIDEEDRQRALAAYDPRAGRTPEAELREQLGELDDALKASALEEIEARQLEAVVELIDERGASVGSASGLAELRRLLRREVIAQAWEEAREVYESTPTDQVGRVARLLEGPLIEPIRIWGDGDSGEELYAYLGLRRDGRGWSRSLYRERAEALNGSREALAAHGKLALALDFNAKRALAPALEPRLEQRAFEAIGLTSLASELEHWLGRVASGAFLSLEAFREGRVAKALKAARKQAGALAAALPARLERAVDRLERLGRRRASGKASEAELQTLESARAALRALEEQSPEQLEATLGSLGA